MISPDIAQQFRSSSRRSEGRIAMTYVTEAATRKTDERASEIGEVFFTAPKYPVLSGGTSAAVPPNALHSRGAWDR